MTRWEKMMREAIRQNAKRYRQIIIDALNEEKEEQVMKVSYNGFTGELVKLEKKAIPHGFPPYDLSIFDVEKRCTITFTGVNLKDVKFLGGAVSFDG